MKRSERKSRTSRKNVASPAAAPTTGPQGLIEGHARFRGQQMPRYHDLFARLNHRQTPLAAFVTCSDARIQPRLITQAEPGDLFVVRNAGNIVSEFSRESSEGAALEFAVRFFKVPHIVVCGHSGCGAMTGLLRPESVSSFPAMQRWLRPARPALDKLTGRNFNSSDEEVAELARENVLLQLRNLATYPFIEEETAQGGLRLHGWFYDIGRGQILEFSEEQEEFVDLLAMSPAWS